MLAGEQERPDAVRRRTTWKWLQARIAPERLVSIDETWTKANMSALRAWRRRGERLHAKVPHGHWKMLTFVAALRHERIEAPGVFDGPVNGECKAYVEQLLAPALRPGDVVVMDNLGSHNGGAVLRAIRAAGVRLYSPDLKAIEVFAKFKAPLRKAEERTVTGLWQRIGGLPDTFTPTECADNLRNAGYASI